ncbi:TenA family protein [Halococcoides cellulosivorans]|uniref:TenA family protein n=1 Tax=Halococcoides cellulosivorans TaxID=1679096 RepID=UPI002D765EDB|nr:TenA family protein [Halococcoides cellulosivorans]
MSPADPASVDSATIDPATFDPETQRFSDWCRERVGSDWTAATEHRFTERLHADTLDDAAFRRYLVQDRAFLADLVGTFGHAVGEAPSMAAKGRLTDFLGVLTDDENDFFQRAFDALDVPESERADPPRAPVTRAFADLLARARQTGGYAATLAVLVPAEWVYLDWARAGESRPERWYLDEWVALHDTDAFADFVSWLRAEFDREAAVAAPARQRQCARLFGRTVELEVAFFEAALAPDSEAVAALTGGGQRW